MIILGIETSCDECAVGIVDDKKNILANVILSQTDHNKFGGVIPEIAARNHLQSIDKVISEALQQAGLEFSKIDAIAATIGPGLIGGLIVGVTMAKTLASIYKKPFIGVNHLEGHALVTRITDDIEFPYLLLLISGGHCEILVVKGVGIYQKIGGTIDDSLGEAFDKTAKILGLDYPGGPIIEKMALEGDSTRFNFTKPLISKKNAQEYYENRLNFSFSGLKTAVMLAFREIQNPSNQDKCDIAASFQKSVTEIVVDRICNTIQTCTNLNKIVVSGGVAANLYIKKQLNISLKNSGFTTFYPPVKLATDNGVMIAWAGLERFRMGFVNSLDAEPMARYGLVDIKNH